MNKARKLPRISVPQGSVAALREKYGCSEVAVYNALRYKSNSVMAQNIRHDALETYGGITTTKAMFSE